MNIYSIYRITNLTNNKIYIGWTSRDPQLRFEEHQKRHKAPISHAIKKYGVNSFVFEIIYQSIDYVHSREIETHFITDYNSLVEQWGYNQDLGGTGHKRTQATIEKHRAAIKGKKQSVEHVEKRKMVGEKNPMFGRIGDKHPLYGKPTSDMQKQRTSEANSKSFIITYPDGSEKTITNLRQFALDHGLDPANLGTTARIPNRTHKGFKARHA